MANPISRALARLTLRFSPARERWLHHIGVYLPLLRDAFPDAPENHLRVLRIADALEARRHEEAAARLEQLLPVIRQSANPHEKALYCVLQGNLCLQSNRPGEAARWMREANKYEHRFHRPHLLLGFHYLYERSQYSRAYDHFDAAISCIYDFPPLDENKRFVIAGMQSGMALALVMMHRPEEAEAMLQRSQAARETAEHQLALAYLSAVLGRRSEAEAALDALRRIDPQRLEHWAPGVQLLLEGTHPHFTAKEPDAGAIAAYWDWFAHEERHLRILLRDQGGPACNAFQKKMFHPLVPEPANLDVMGVGFRMENGQPSLAFCDYFSRTYEKLCAALVAACPPEVTAHWRVTAVHGNPEAPQSPHKPGKETSP